MRLLRVAICAVLCLLGLGLGLARVPAPLHADSSPPPLRFDLAGIPVGRPAVLATRVPPGLPALTMPDVAPAVGVPYLAVGATVVSPAARQPLAGTGFTPAQRWSSPTTARSR
jgi:hypothetical protein